MVYLLTYGLSIDSYDSSYLCFTDLDYNNCNAETVWEIP